MVVLVRPGLRAVDRRSSVPEQELVLLAATAVFAPLSPVALERLAGRLEPLLLPAGAAAVREGEVGDFLLLVVTGRLAMETTQSAGVIHTVGPLTREAFLAAVTGNPQSARQTQHLVATRIAHRRAVLGER